MYTSQEVDGLGTGVSTLYVTLTKADLLAEFTCLVESSALTHPIESRISPDVLGKHESETNFDVEHLTARFA